MQGPWVVFQVFLLDVFFGGTINGKAPRNFRNILKPSLSFVIFFGVGLNFTANFPRKCIKSLGFEFSSLTTYYLYPHIKLISVALILVIFIFKTTFSWISTIHPSIHPAPASWRTIRPPCRWHQHRNRRARRCSKNNPHLVPG